MFHRFWDLLLHKLAVDPLWAIALGILLGSGGVTWLGWLDGLTWTAKFTYGIWAVLGMVLLLTVPQFFYARSRSSRRQKMSDAIFALIQQSHGLREGTPEHSAWERKAAERIRRFDPIWANDFASMKYRTDAGEVLREQQKKLGVQLVSIREDKDVY